MLLASLIRNVLQALMVGYRFKSFSCRPFPSRYAALVSSRFLPHRKNQRFPSLVNLFVPSFPIQRTSLTQLLWLGTLPFSPQKNGLIQPERLLPTSFPALFPLIPSNVGDNRTASL
ncbi:hypothetical protein Acr_05g0013260 [Actinidia rufa]|uniref:Uncharacterized protein n=1 Tax=Actinidia rufa TaxID=165716 RepID=A0A7J0D7Q0_9ERIC|nr:hypothetical protein Acr_00g0000220 [Actinidia rufa]GFS28132.1 hypothetical protein Acr_00g0000240 [Actinidia rufa]GFS28545.1 hypothetical protein Acr_00g0002460 [Actinidia rufa]GFY87382.1 hypothetical protein Acr_05g0010210 [Actinidia rufa]GFY87687.1 hypothetical protein Acr_05g0013260 [Actinidia rufa]